jgi:hypothetical protein
MTEQDRLSGKLDSRAVGDFAAALRRRPSQPSRVRLLNDGRECTVIGALGQQATMVAEAAWCYDCRRFGHKGLPD